MRIEIQVPELSESVQGGTLLAWRKQAGERVERDEVLADLETDKVVLEIAAPASGALVAVHVGAGSEVVAGDVIAEIDTEATVVAPVPAPTVIVPPQPPVNAKVATPSPALPEERSQAGSGHLRPSARKARLETPVPTPTETAPSASVEAPAPHPAPAPTSVQVAARPDNTANRGTRRVPMSRLRQRIAERLKAAQNTAAILTTFNEINMQPVQALRSRYQEPFQKEHGVKLGFMSFFVKAACQALKQFPGVNASVEGRDIVYHDYQDIGIAVSSERGLVVPVLRDASQLSFADIEKRIADFGRRANSLELSLEELEGGTFTISNGGVFGSLLSTPILNPPQSGVLGLHKIQDRPVAESGQVVIRPMMYIALSYDHRIIDGREAVSFLRAVKEDMEDPARLLLEL
jgi:2-oxoglutarate dehydrogenase E2 component (dihydrolipoamide succinyltransferase)